MSLRSPERQAQQTAIKARIKVASASLSEHLNHFGQIEVKYETANKRAEAANLGPLKKLKPIYFVYAIVLLIFILYLIVRVNKLIEIHESIGYD